jgi:hypothetical protein
MSETYRFDNKTGEAHQLGDSDVKRSGEEKTIEEVAKIVAERMKATEKDEAFRLKEGDDVAAIVREIQGSDAIQDPNVQRCVKELLEEVEYPEQFTKFENMKLESIKGDYVVNWMGNRIRTEFAEDGPGLLSLSVTEYIKKGVSMHFSLYIGEKGIFALNGNNSEGGKAEISMVRKFLREFVIEKKGAF